MALESPLHRVFCQNLRRLRIAANLTQVEVADRMGIAQSQYNSLEAGRNTPTLPTIEKAAAAVGVSADELLSAAKKLSVAG